MPIAIITKQVFLYTSVAIAVIVAFQMMDTLGVWDNVWASGGYLFFPGAAIVSGWISLAISRKKINRLFIPAAVDYYRNAVANNSTIQNL